MTCSVVFHFKVKKPIMQSHFLGNSHLIFLTENSLLLFSFETSSFVDELKLWEDEKTAKYIRDFNLNDMDILSEEQVHWVCVGNEVGQVIVWKLEIDSSQQIKKQFQIFDIYNSTRTKRLEWAQVEQNLFLVTVSTAGHISVFDFLPEKQSQFTSDSTSSKLLAALAEKKMEVRITQLGVCSLPKINQQKKDSVPKTNKEDTPIELKKKTKRIKKKKLKTVKQENQKTTEEDTQIVPKKNIKLIRKKKIKLIKKKKIKLIKKKKPNSDKQINRKNTKKLKISVRTKK